jgi:hypothetical protein
MLQLNKDMLSYYVEKYNRQYKNNASQRIDSAKFTPYDLVKLAGRFRLFRKQLFTALWQELNDNTFSSAKLTLIYQGEDEQWPSYRKRLKEELAEWQLNLIQSQTITRSDKKQHLSNLSSVWLTLFYDLACNYRLLALQLFNQPDLTNWQSFETKIKSAVPAYKNKESKAVSYFHARHASIFRLANTYYKYQELLQAESFPQLTNTQLRRIAANKEDLEVQDIINHLIAIPSCQDEIALPSAKNSYQSIPLPEIITKTKSLGYKLKLGIYKAINFLTLDFFCRQQLDRHALLTDLEQQINLQNLALQQLKQMGKMPPASPEVETPIAIGPRRGSLTRMYSNTPDSSPRYAAAYQTPVNHQDLQNDSEYSILIRPYKPQDSSDSDSDDQFPFDLEEWNTLLGPTRHYLEQNNNQADDNPTKPFSPEPG